MQNKKNIKKNSCSRNKQKTKKTNKARGFTTKQSKLIKYTKK